MYHQAYRPRRRSSIFIPFLMLVTLLLAAVLVYQLWSYFHERNLQQSENKAAITVAQGRAEMLVWGQSQWVSALTGGVLREGDSLHVFPNSRVSLALLNGGFVRVDGDTELTLSALKTKDREDVVAVELAHGDVWLKKSKSDAVKTSFSVSSPDFTVRTLGTIFEVSKRDDMRVRVMEGRVAVDVKNEENGKVRVIDTFEVGVGQEADVSAVALEAFRKRENPEVIFALSDTFKGTDWYTWNTQEDLSGTAVTVQQAVQSGAEQKTPLITGSPGNTKTTISSSVSVSSGPLPKPAVTTPDESRRSSTDAKVVVRGTTDERTQKIIVSTFIAGKKDSYALQKYVPGSIEWSYIASADLGNYVPGRNEYEIVAEDKDGVKSPAASLTLIYDKPKEKADLQAPTIVTFNGKTAEGTTYETCEEPVTISGKIGKGIVKVFVNDFALTRYVPDREAWSYKAQASFGNLKEGDNEYEVYGTDTDGNKTPSLKFTIKKCAAAPATVPAASPPASETETSNYVEVNVTPSAPQ